MQEWTAPWTRSFEWDHCVGLARVPTERGVPAKKLNLAQLLPQLSATSSCKTLRSAIEYAQTHIPGWLLCNMNAVLQLFKWQSYKILPHCIIDCVLCSVLAAGKPSNSWICCSNQPSRIIFHCLTGTCFVLMQGCFQSQHPLTPCLNQLCLKSTL